MERPPHSGIDVAPCYVVRLGKWRGVVGLALVMAGGVACETEPPVTPTCILTIEPPSRNLGAEAGEATASVMASSATCAWSAASNASWLAVAPPASGVGPGTIRYTVTANPVRETRTASIAVGNASHTVTQAAAPAPLCAYTVSPREFAISAAQASRQVSLSTDAGCPWAAVSQVAWMTVVSAASGVGPALIDIRIEANRQETSRAGIVTIADQAVMVSQAGEEPSPVCTYQVSPLEFSPCMAAGTLVTRIETQASCSWTMSASAPWLTVRDSAGVGPADIRADYSSNYDAPRQGLLLVRWPTPTAGQNVLVNQAGCRYFLSRSRIDVAATTSSATVDVVQQSDPAACGGPTQNRCVWSAEADVVWITITTPMPRMGDDRIFFTVSANSSGQTRTGRITVRDQQVLVVQAAQ
jgi:hypothetical protein